MDIDLSQFYEVFFDETEEHLHTLENELLQTELSLDAESLNSIFRAAHSIKGSASTFGFTGLAALTHTMEALLDAVRKGRLDLSSERVDCLLSAVDLSRHLLLDAREGVMHPRPDEIERMQQALQDCMESVPASSSSSPSVSTSIASQNVFYIEIVVDPNFDWERLFDVLAAFPAIILDPNAADFDGGRLKLSSECNSDSFDLFLNALQNKIDGHLSQSSAKNYCFDARVQPVALEEASDFGLFDSIDTANASVSPSENDWGGLFVDSSVPAESPATTSEDEWGGLFVDLPTPNVDTEKVEKIGTLAVPADKNTEDQHTKKTSVPLVANRVAPTPTSTVQSGEHAATIRVGVDKVDSLLNLVGELVITKSILLECLGEEMINSQVELTNAMSQLERNTRSLQHAVVSIRMVPIVMIFQRFPRVVRDLASKLSKKVELIFEGEGTEIDKGFIEKLADPLTHLVRNSLDHGIEAPEVREANGKNPMGRLILRAFQQSGYIVIQIEDDGAGLNRERILAKALASGLPIAEDAPDAAVWDLIFAAGFSTSSEVTDVSGRGVGMDVVRRNIQNLGGVIDIQSKAGLGTTITLRLPLTLAILDGILIRLGQEHYIIPVNVINESIQIESSMFHFLENRYRVISVRDEYLSVIDLGEILQVPKNEDEQAPPVGVVVSANKTRSVFLVDEILGQHQVVIKNLENNLYHVNGISGATIMGNGKVTLILDVHTLVKMAKDKETLPRKALV